MRAIAATAALTVFDVPPHVEVCEQARFLEHVTDLAVMHRPRFRRILPDIVCDNEMAGRAALEAGNAAQ